MSKIEYIRGDLFEHIPEYYDRKNTIVIPHICNDIGAWGSGFVVPLGKKYPIAKQVYHARHNTMGLKLGEVHMPLVDDGIYVANMIAQNGISSKSTGDKSKINSKPIRYASLCKCLTEINSKFSNCDIYAPKFGSDRSGGKWEFIEELIDEILTDVNSIKIFIL